MENGQIFKLPQPLLDRIYSLTGGTNKHKGMMLIYISENGEPIVYSKFDDKTTEITILSTAKDFVEQAGATRFEGENL